MSELLEKLNPAQREAVQTTEGMVRVIAGAGSGKTRALTARFAYLVNEMGILPGEHTMRHLLKQVRERDARTHTQPHRRQRHSVHKHVPRLLRIRPAGGQPAPCSTPKSFLVIDNSDIDAMLRTIYEERGLTLRDMTFSSARDMIEILKLKERPDYYLDMLEMSPDVLYQKYMDAASPKDIIFYGYLYQEKRCFALDYNDLLVFTLHIFRENEEIRLKWQQRLEYIMIDEFQDIDDIQYRLMEVLCAYHGNLFVVGDPDQTIYTWRGANVRFLLDFDKKFENVRTIMMMENYRSTPEILAAANSLISRNAQRIEKSLIPTLPHGPRVACHWAKDSAAEAEWIVTKIAELRSGGTALRDICILYRAHYVTRELEEALLTAEIPYTIYSGAQFFSRAEVKDAPLLPPHGSVPGRSLLPAHSKRPQAQPRRAADEVS